ncbi:MAG: class II glutamine amidotransferase [Eubacteriales bacterium]|nr:class II glutamine amidotransferase [Eubacteriales bacterium]
MCGIFGYVGKDNAIKKVIRGLEKLEYRGYDSAGLAYIKQKNIEVLKSVGKVENLKVLSCALSSNLSIAHTRWATHGKASEINCHPHTSKNFAIVHNGIIENFEFLKKNLKYKFYSETDTEVVVKLLEENLKNTTKFFETEKAILHAIKETQDLLKGSWAIALICKIDPNKIYVFKNKSPLVLGKAENGSYVASDMNAIEEDLDFVNLEDENIAVVAKDKVEIFDKNLMLFKPETIRKSEQVIKENGIFPHKMIKEINEIPRALCETKNCLKMMTFVILPKCSKISVK